MGMHAAPTGFSGQIFGAHPPNVQPQQGYPAGGRAHGGQFAPPQHHQPGGYGSPHPGQQHRYATQQHGHHPHAQMPPHAQMSPQGYAQQPPQAVVVPQMVYPQQQQQQPPPPVQGYGAVPPPAAAMMMGGMPPMQPQHHQMRVPTFGKLEPIENYYDIREVLGKGAFSEVRNGVERTTGKEWAIKIMKKNFRDPSSIEITAAEIQIYKAAGHHRNIVVLHDIYENQTHWFLVLNKITGGELLHRITQLKRFSERDASEFTAQMLCGIKHLHDLNIAHRDLKVCFSFSLFPLAFAFRSARRC
jgi:Protein kinase domain